MYNRLNPLQSYQICTGGSSSIPRGSRQSPPRKFRDSTSIRKRPLPAISLDNTPFMKRPIIRRYIVSVTGTVVSNPQKRLPDTWSVVTCIQIGYGTQQSNAGIRKCLFVPLFLRIRFLRSLHPIKNQRRLDESEMHSPLVHLFHLTTTHRLLHIQPTLTLKRLFILSTVYLFFRTNLTINRGY